MVERCEDALPARGASPRLVSPTIDRVNVTMAESRRLQRTLWSRHGFRQ